MKTLDHPVAPEEIMAMLDEELSTTERQAVLAHLSQCAECAALRLRFESTSHALAEWQIPAAPETLRSAVEEAAAAKSERPSNPRRRLPHLAWAVGGTLAAGLALVLLAPSREQHTSIQTEELQRERARLGTDGANTGDALTADSNGLLDARSAGRAAPAPPIEGGTDRFKGGMDELIVTPPGAVSDNNALLHKPIAGNTLYEELDKHVPGAAAVVPKAAAPMIAREVSLTILVKNIPQARTALDGILSSHAGYAATLNVNTPESGSPSIVASLRIPAPQLDSALARLRTLGQVEAEAQSGEEVTQQHEDLVARLLNARETEDRLRAILAQRAGKMNEILEVEEQISQTRGEIEQMEAEQTALEHRVDYVMVDLQLTEQYEARLTGQPTAIGTQMRNALVTGIRDAGSSLLGLVLLIEEIGPAILVWVAILGFPAWIVWRRYRRAQARF
jgi:Domain of unknown function (DUF4349)/Putative zinc-finger